MATSPSHKLGQMIGNMLEDIMSPILKNIVQKHSLYLDVVGHKRPGVRGKKLTWLDSYDSAHDLDFVIESGGSDLKRGRPVAFIETAWRRYTKHSKNKAQEIQGAILPIADRYYQECPFKGAILAGVFTAPSLAQLRATGFEVLYISYESIVEAFKGVGVDISFDENTSTADLLLKVKYVESLTFDQMQTVHKEINSLNSQSIGYFIKQLELKLNKTLKRINIIPSYGNSVAFVSPKEAKEFINTYDYGYDVSDLGFVNFLINIEYLNGDTVRAEFSDKDRVINFLDNILI